MLSYRSKMGRCGICLFGVFWLFLSLSGCSTTAPVQERRVEEAGETAEPGTAPTAEVPLQSTEDRIDRHFRMAYEGIDFYDLTREEQALFQDKAFLETDFAEFVRVMGEFIRRKLPYVDTEQPQKKDFAFLIRYGDAVYCYEEFLGIDPDNLTEPEIEYVREFRRLYPSGQMDSGTFPNLEPEVVKTLLLFVNPDNLSDRDLVLLYRLGIRYERRPPLR